MIVENGRTGCESIEVWSFDPFIPVAPDQARGESIKRHNDRLHMLFLFG